MSDATYMEAVKRGDMKTAQRMVDAAAEAAGFTIGPVYHGTKGKKKNIFPFTVFDTSRRGSLTTQVGTPSGSYFTPNKRYAEGAANYASNMGRSGKPVVGAFYLRSDVEKTPGVETEIEFFATNPSQIKSADPVTYDDSGNVIPLSQRFSRQSEDIRNPRQLMGININDKCQDFTGQILRGEKTIETRNTRSLDPYIGERIGIVRTGISKQKATLVGYATVGEPVVYDSVAKFRRDYDKHLVAPGSAFDIKDGLKYGYPLMQVESITPKLVQSKGIVARKLNPASRTVDEAAKKAGYTTKAFHRTSSKFTKFIPGGPNATRQIWRTKSGESRTLFGQSGRAMWFGTSPDNLPAYHNEPTGKGVVLTVYLKNPNPLQIDDDTRDWARDVYADGSKEFPLLLSDEHIRNIRGDGYTGIEYWRKGKTAEKSSPDEIVVFDANQIKSADLVTYDDAGNSIPISNRFSGKVTTSETP